ncbi:MAG: hypothetical protein R3359_09560, partial [Marinirhabdus sp.]|nr:hypothetical protein [Marinirhabdus sp.]
MIHVKDNKVTEIMRSLSVEWNGDFIEKADLCKIAIDNQVGKGTVTTYEMVPGLTAYVYNATF